MNFNFNVAWTSKNCNHGCKTLSIMNLVRYCSWRLLLCNTYTSNSKMMCPWIVPNFLKDDVCTNSCWVSPMRPGLHVIHVLAPVLVSFVISCQASEFRQDSSRFHHNCLSTIHKLITLKSCLLIIISENFWFKLSLLNLSLTCCRESAHSQRSLVPFCDSYLVIFRGTNHSKNWPLQLLC